MSTHLGWRVCFDSQSTFRFRSSQYDEFRKPIEQSLKVLKETEKELFRNLVIFTDNVKIPIKVSV